MKRPFAILTYVLCALPLVANAECSPPPPLSDETKKVETEGAIGKLLQLVGLNFKVSVETEKKAVFKEYPNADQMNAALSALHDYCSRLELSTTLSDKEKLELLAQRQDALLAPVMGPRAIASTAPMNRGQVRPPQEQLRGTKRSGLNVETARIVLVAMSGAKIPNARSDASWADVYLNPTPLLITDKNKHFVIVGSAPNEAAGRKLMNDLKAQYPDYDFELYGPYGSNPSYGIMMAAWVSQERAAEALRAAKKIEPTSLIWSCRGSGDEC
jgi:hypothetical protein